MKSFKFYLLCLSLLSVMFSSCGDDETSISDGQSFDNGVLIVNEGPFSGGSATLDYYDNAQDSLIRDVYSTVNDGQVIGSILQSVTVIGNDAYLVVNNSAKIEVVDATTMAYKNTITGVFGPRYIADLGNGSAVISEWGSDGVTGQLKLIDLTTMMVTDSVSVSGPEQMIVSGAKIYVANSGGFGESNKVTVHDLDLAQQSEIIVGKRAIDMVEDANGDIWVLSGGSFGTNDGASICRIVGDATDFCKELSGFPSDLISDASGNNLYYVENGGVMKLELGNEGEDITLATNVTGTIYGLGYDGSQNTLYVATTPDFSSESTTYVISSDGSTKEFTTGVLTNSFVAR